MINQEQIEKATVWELQQQLEFFQRDADHARSWLQKLNDDTAVLKITLCLKINGQHKFHDGVCGCGAVLKEENIERIAG